MDAIYDNQRIIGTSLRVFDDQRFFRATPPGPGILGGRGQGASGGGKLPRLEELTTFKKIEKRKKGVSLLEALRGPDPVEPPPPKVQTQLSALQENVAAIRVDVAAILARLGPEPEPVDEAEAEAEILLILSTLL
jgi:hypothetical protein